MNNKPGYILPIILVTSLFFLWGLDYGLLDVLNKRFQETSNINKQRSMLLQASYFGAYFLIALPAGLFHTIFALGVKNLGGYTKKGSSFIIISIVGGALVPYAMGS